MSRPAGGRKKVADQSCGIAGYLVWRGRLERVDRGDMHYRVEYHHPCQTKVASHDVDEGQCG